MTGIVRVSVGGACINNYSFLSYPAYYSDQMTVLHVHKTFIQPTSRGESKYGTLQQWCFLPHSRYPVSTAHNKTLAIHVLWYHSFLVRTEAGKETKKNNSKITKKNKLGGTIVIFAFSIERAAVTAVVGYRDEVLSGEGGLLLLCGQMLLCAQGILPVAAALCGHTLPPLHLSSKTAQNTTPQHTNRGQYTKHRKMGSGGKLRRQLFALGHKGEVTEVAVTPDSSKVVSCSHLCRGSLDGEGSAGNTQPSGTAP